MKKLKLTILLPALFACFYYPSTAAVTSVNVLPVGASGQYLEATSTNNPVLHIRIAGADTMTSLEIKNELDSWYIGNAYEPGVIAAGSVKVWYVSIDTDTFNPASAAYVTYLAETGGTFWSNTFIQTVADGSGIWVTVDITATPSYGTVEMQTESLIFTGAPGINSNSEPSSPSVFIVTDVTPAENLEIYHTPGNMQSFLSTGQENMIPFDINFYNNSPQSSADINVNMISFTVKNLADATLVPSELFANIRLVDKNQGTKYGEITQLLMPGTATAIKMPLSLLNVPAGVTVHTSVQISLTQALSAADAEFALSLYSASDINAYDYYTGKNVSITASVSAADAFPMYSNFAKIQKACQSINASHTAILPDPKYINKGATNIELMKFYFSNPGDTMTASAEVYNMRLLVNDNTGAPVIPRDLFSKISLTDESGNIKYRVKTSDTIEASGNAVVFSMANTIVVPAASGVTVVVRVDISTTSVINNFRLSLGNISDVTGRDKNSLLTCAVLPLQGMPYLSPLGILSSSFKAGHTPRMPANIYPGQTSIHAMDLGFSSPLSFGSGTLLIRGITLTAKNAAGAPVDFSGTVSKIRITSGTVTAEITSPSSTSAYFAFPEPLTIPALPGSLAASVYMDLPAVPALSSIQITLESASISAYQNNEPGRDIFVSADSGDSFPMSSGTGYIASDSTSESFTNYPNPFKNTTVIAYYLAGLSTVSISIYDLTGSLIKEICAGASKSAGSHQEDTWDGTGKNTRKTMAGTYLAVIEIKDASGTKKRSRKITLVK